MIHNVREPLLHITYWFPFCILKSSYSWIRACFLTLFTSFVPSCMTSKMSHISLAELHCETLKNSSQLGADVIIFLAIQSNLTFLLYASVHLDEGLSTKKIIFLNLRYQRTIFNWLPNAFISWVYKNFHSHFPKLIIDSTKQRWPVYWGTFPKWHFINHQKIFKNRNQNLSKFQEPFSWLGGGGSIVYKRFSQILCLEWNFNNQLKKAIQKANQISKQKQITEL